MPQNHCHRREGGKRADGDHHPHRAVGLAQLPCRRFGNLGLGRLELRAPRMCSCRRRGAESARSAGRWRGCAGSGPVAPRRDALPSFLEDIDLRRDFGERLSGEFGAAGTAADYALPGEDGGRGRLVVEIEPIEVILHESESRIDGDHAVELAIDQDRSRQENREAGLPRTGRTAARAAIRSWPS